MDHAKVDPDLLEKLPKAHYTLADKGYVRKFENRLYKNHVLPRKKNSKTGNTRHLAENVFVRLKHFRAIAIRYDKYASMLARACSYIWPPM
ncbi:transposase [Legionella cincinnatiensis]|uniref:Transposase n=1 Tax=Legionella cincinnatiensis TaxID=28085 RepID=A0A378IVP0_9GAMM|nr:transposase [Legionella cincinnatiensis]STX36084.1 transposase [Legionella cincinnatiensis]